MIIETGITITEESRLYERGLMSKADRDALRMEVKPRVYYVTPVDGRGIPPAECKVLNTALALLDTADAFERELAKLENGNLWLITPAGRYEAPTLGRLLWELLKHRLHHFLRGEGWRD